MKPWILWDVDTQVDFVLADGKLAVPDAEAAVPAMARLVAAARAAGIVHVASADDHELTDPELSQHAGLPQHLPAALPAHTRGAQKIPETEQDDPLPLGALPFPPGLVPDLVAGRREILLLKKNFDVFTNPNAERCWTRSIRTRSSSSVSPRTSATTPRSGASCRRGRRVRFVEDASRGLDEPAWPRARRPGAWTASSSRPQTP